MKKLVRSRAFALLLTFVTLASAAQAADYYVVIGTFAEEANARRYARSMRYTFGEVSYSFNHARKVFYVHVFKSARKEDAQKQLVYVKKEKGLRDVWVYTDSAGITLSDSYRVGSAPRQPHSQAEAKGETGFSSLSQGPIMASTTGGPNFLSYSDHGSSEARIAALRWTNKSGVSFIRDVEDPARLLKSESFSEDNFFTFVVEDPQGRKISSEVMLVDFERARKITSFRTGKHAAIRGTRREQMVSLVCDVMGYAQETRMYNIDHLGRGRDISKNKDGVWEVRFRLQKMEVNDVAFMNKTVFHEDAAVMQESSEDELQELVSVMKANPGYRITIHGHCNAKGRREIRLPKAGRAYFDITRAESKPGSDKRLAKERARAVRSYLVDHGIAKKRIDIIGWGGMEPLAKPGSADAAMNDRVEFELVEDKEN